MKKTLLFLSLLLPVFSAFAAFPIESKQSNASFQKVTFGNGQTISLDAFTTMTDNDYEILTGKKLGLFGRLHFHQEQRKLQQLLNSDADDTEKVYKDLDQSKGFNLAGFMMGLTLSLVGVGAMYLTKKESRKANRTKWAWIGAAFWVAFLIVLIAIA